MKRIRTVSCFILLIFLIGSTEQSFSSSKNIFQAIKNNDFAAVKVILRENINDLKVLNEDKYTPLHLASESGCLRIVQYLVKKGACINQKNHQENTPLHLASNKKHFPVVKFLISNGADVNIKNFRGRIAALSAIVHYSSFEIIKHLINNWADINTVDSFGSTLLLRACSRKYPKIVDLLLKKNIKLPTAQNKVRQLISASFFIDHFKLLNLLLEKNPQINLKDNEDYFVLRAVQYGSINLLKLLIKKKFSLIAKNRYGNSAIHLAARNGFIPIMELLLKNGIKINKKNKMGRTAYHIAKEKKKKDMLEFLIKSGADQKTYVFPALKGPYLGQKTPDNKPEIFALGIVSKEGLEHSPPVFSKDGTRIFWATEFPTFIIGSVLKNGFWTRPEKMVFNSGFGDGEPVFSNDNSKLFFLSKRTLNGKSKSNRERIWFVKRIKNGWSEAICLNKNANLYPMHWTISMDENDSIYFPSKHSSGFGKQDIYKTEIINGIYQKPQNLGSGINSKLVEHTPFISRDQSYFISAIIGHPDGKGLADLFVFFKKKDGTWTKPQNLGEMINSPGMDLCPSVTPDGKYLFYIRGNDIYWVRTDIIRNLKKKVLKDKKK